MKLDFDITNIRKNTVELLDCQIDLILRSLEFYSYTYQFIYPRNGKSVTKEENLRISLVTDTYHQILNEYNNQNFKSYKNEFIQDDNDNLKKVS